MGVSVPSIYQQYVTQAAQDTGLPAAVVAAQIDYESGFNPNAVSPTGAQGIAQFEPGTWSSYGTGSPFNVQNAFAAYAKYMKTLLNQFNGNVTDALEAYNAGPGDLGAGAGYAQHILSVAGSPGGMKITNAGNGTGATTSPGGAPTPNAQPAFDLGGFLNKAFSWLTQDPITTLLGEGASGLAGSLASGLEQGLMRAFLDILVQVWNKLVKPFFWMFEVTGGAIIMLASLAALAKQSPAGPALGGAAGAAGALPGPWGKVAGITATLVGGGSAAKRAKPKDSAKDDAPAPAPQESEPAPAPKPEKRRVYSGGGQDTDPQAVRARLRARGEQLAPRQNADRPTL